jgi:hypothetical protein
MTARRHPLRFPTKQLDTTPIYELFDNTATTRTVEKGGMRKGYCSHDRHDGVQCIFRCPKCGYAMQIEGGRTIMGSLLSLRLRCDNQLCEVNK